MSNEGIAGRQCNGIGVLERGGGGDTEQFVTYIKTLQKLHRL